MQLVVTALTLLSKVAITDNNLTITALTLQAKTTWILQVLQ